MRQVRFLPVLLLTLLLSSCNDEFLIKDGGTVEQGTLSLNLSMDSGLVITKIGDAEDGAMTAQDTLDKFKVEIYKKVSDDLKDGIRLYKALYADAKEELIPLDAGDYFLRAKFGDSLGIGFDRPFLMAEKEFTVRPQTRETVSAVAKIANVKVSVNFGDYFQEYYPEYYAKVVNNDPNLAGYVNSLTFVKDEDRSGFIHHGEMTVEVYADFKGDGNWNYYQISGIDADANGVVDDAEKFRYSPNDHITFDIDAADKLYGNLLVNIQIENGTDSKEYQVEVPEYKAPQSAPKVSRQGFDVKVEESDGYAYVYENRDVEYNGGQSLSYSAKAGLKKCELSITSDYLKTTYGIDGTYTIAALASDGVTVVQDAAVVASLKAAGIRCGIDKFMGIVDFTDAMKALGKNSVYVSDTEVCAAFSMTVTDEAGATASVDGRLLVWPETKGTWAIPEYDVWGWKVVSPVVELTKGKPDNCMLQISTDGKNWSTLYEEGDVNGTTITYPDVAGLKTDMDYWLRVSDGEFLVADVIQVHTEYPYQIGNAGFEDWRTVVFDYYQDKVLWTGGKWATRDWYLPYKSGAADVWWAVNSKKTMPSNVTGDTATGLGGSTQTFKVFPTVSYSVNKYQGDYSAQLMTIGVGYSAQSSGLGIGDKWVVPGELFLGTADDSGNPTYGGHVFASRPGKISFMYQYVPSSKMTGDNFYALVEVKSGDTTLARKEINGPSASEWTEYVVDLEYTVTDMKATTIYVTFKSSKNTFSANTDYLDENVAVEVAGNSFNVHRGSVLRIDDIKVLYE